MSIQKRFCAFFFITFFFTPQSILASNKEDSFAIPEDMKGPLTTYMQKHCAPIPCHTGYYLRPTTPDEYLIINEETEIKEPYKIVDFFMAPIERQTSNCVLSLYAATQLTHPVAMRTPEKDEAKKDSFVFGESIYSFFDKKSTFLGIISVEPHKTTGLSSPHINYYLLKGHREQGYSTLMISGFIKYLRALEGKKLFQITLPQSADCLEILRNTLKGIYDPSQTAFSDIPSSMITVGPIHAHVPLENPPSFVPLSKTLFFTGRFHLEPQFSESLGYLVEGITPEETRAVGIHLIFSSQEPDDNDFSPLRKKLMVLFKGYCTAERKDRPDLYPTLRKTAFEVVDEDEGKDEKKETL